MKQKIILVVISALVAMSLALSGCNDSSLCAVTFVVDGQTYHSTVVLNDTNVELPEPPSREGYNFAGWHYDAQGTQPFDAQDPIVTDTVLHAVFQPSYEGVTYTVNFVSEQGTLVSGATTLTVDHGATATAPVFEREGWVLSWDAPLVITSDITINAVWTPATYTVTFAPNGGSYASGKLQQTVQHGAAAVAPVLNMTGHTLGWSIAFDCVTANLVVTAVWTRNVCTITFDAGEGTLVSGNQTQQLLFGDPIVAPIFEREGWHYTWDDLPATAVADATITAVWQINTYTVTFDRNGGLLLSGKTVQVVEHGSAAVAPVFSNGTSLLSWDAEFDCVTSDLVVTALWSLPRFQVTFDLDGGTLVQGDLVQQVQTGSSATAPQTQRTGWTLVGWSVDFDNITTDLTVTALWQIRTFDVLFVFDEGELVSGQLAQVIEYGARAIAPVLERKHYALGWDAEFGCITSDLVINAVWTLTSHIVTFDPGMGTVTEGQAVVLAATGTSAIAPTVQRYGYDFVGWDSDPSVITNDITITALWTRDYSISTPGLNFVLIDETIEVSHGELQSFEGEILLPLTHAGYPVTSIAKNGFYNSKLTAIALTPQITNIGENAFWSCTNLTSVWIPADAVLGKAAFGNCTALQTVTFAQGRTVIGSVDIFSGCLSLTQLTLPASLTKFDPVAFEKCPNLASISVAEGSKSFVSIDGVLFSADGSELVMVPPARTGDLVLDQTVVSIAPGAFANGSALTSVTIPSSVQFVGWGAFALWTQSQTIYLLGRAELPPDWADSVGNANIVCL